MDIHLVHILSSISELRCPFLFISLLLNTHPVNGHLAIPNVDSILIRNKIFYIYKAKCSGGWTARGELNPRTP